MALCFFQEGEMKMEGVPVEPGESSRASVSGEQFNYSVTG